MIMAGNMWKWPGTHDKAFYELGDIVHVVRMLSEKPCIL